MTIYGRAFSGDTESAALFNPFIASAPISPRGIPIGIELSTGRVVYFDPWLLKQLGIINGTIFLLLGEREAGKTTLLNMFLMRLLMRQARVELIDGKRCPLEMTARITTRKSNMGDVEMKPINDHLRGNFVDLNQRGYINIFDPKMNMSEWDLLETSVNLTEMANNGIALTGYQPLALQVGVYKMLTQYPEMTSPEGLELATRHLTEDDVSAYYRSSNSQVLNNFSSVLDGKPELLNQLKLMLNQPHNISKHELLADAGFVSSQVGRVLRADFGQVFGGTNSLYDLLTDNLTTLNMTGLNPKARTLIESMLWKWSTVGLINRDFGLNPGINVADEEHEGANSLMYMRFWAAYVAKSRAFHTLDLRATQFLRQLLEAGQEGSEIRSLAKQIGMGIGGYFIGKQPDNETALDDIRGLGLEEHDVQFTKRLNTGEFGFKVPERPVVFFKAIVTPTELALSRSNQAADSMMDFVPAMSDPEIQSRAARLGFVQLGMPDLVGVER